MLALGMMGWEAERSYSSLQPQATEDQARGPHEPGHGHGRRDLLWAFFVLTLRRHPQRLNVLCC